MELNNNTKIGVAVGCFLVALVIMYFTVFKNMFGGSGGGGGSDKIVMLCTNPKCDKAFKLTPDEYSKEMQGGGMDPMMMMMGPSAIKCKFCGQKTAMVATECENQQCKNVFIAPNPMMGGQMNMNDPFFYDRCPQCKQSASEKASKSAK